MKTCREGRRVSENELSIMLGRKSIRWRLVDTFKGVQMVGPTTWICLSALEAGSCSWTSASVLWNVKCRSNVVEKQVRPSKVNVICTDTPHWVEVEHGRLKLGQFNGGDAEGPDVTQVVVPALLLHRHYLWSHPAKKQSSENVGFWRWYTAIKTHQQQTNKSQSKQQVVQLNSTIPLTSRGFRWKTSFWLPRHWSLQPPQNQLDRQSICDDELD